MNSSILVTGGTGTLGREVVTRLRVAGRAVRILSRHSHASADGVEFVSGNLATGEGVDGALAGIGIVVHCAGSAKGDEIKARTLVVGAKAAAVRHLLYISVVGADRIPLVSGVDRAMFGYFGMKRAAEVIVAESGVPWTTLRATQFHTLVLTVAQSMAKLPLIPVPAGVRFQPVDARDVAERLVELAVGEPAGLVADMGGPRVYGFAELLRSYLQAHGTRRPMMRVPVPGKAARALQSGANLSPDGFLGHRTWEAFLAEQLPAD